MTTQDERQRTASATTRPGAHRVPHAESVRQRGSKTDLAAREDGRHERSGDRRQ